MRLVIATAAYIGAGVCLYVGLSNSSLMTAMVGAVLMAAGNYYVKLYKQDK